MAVTEEGLRFLLLADVDQFERAMKDANTAADNAAKGIVAAGKQIQGSGNYIDGMRTNLRSLVEGLKTGESRFVSFGSSVNKTGKIVQNYQQRTANAGGALTSFSRIVQDAPFGIIGVGNNITQFAEQFQFLTRQTGSAGAAFRALGQSLIGAGGITLGISLLITGITQLTQKYGSLGNAIQALFNPLSQQAKIQKEVNDTMLQGTKDAQSELATLDSLYRAATNVNVPLNERNKIVDELQKRYPSYLGNLSNEQILTGNAADAYNRLRDSVVAAAKAKAIQNRIGELATKQLDNEIAREKALDALLKAQAKEDRAKQIDEASGAYAALGRSATGAGVATQNAAAELRKLTEEGNVLQGSIDKLVQKGNQLSITFGAVGTGVKDAANEVKKIKPVFEELDLDRVLSQQRLVSRPEPVVIEQPIDISLVGLQDAMKRGQEQIKGFQQGIKLSFDDFQHDIGPAIKSGAASIASGFGEAIGEIIAGGKGLDQVFKGVIGVFGNFIKQLGESMIAAGTAAIAAKFLIKNPYTAVAAGIIAVAAGTAINAALNKAPSFATGGTVYGPQLIAAGDNTTNKEHILSDLQLQKIAQGAGIGGGGEIIAETYISGTDLGVVLRRSGLQVTRING